MSRPNDQPVFRRYSVGRLDAVLCLLAASLIFSPFAPAYAGSAPDVPAPTCVKWCGNDTESSDSAPSDQTHKHKSSHTPMPSIDVGAMMDAAKARKNKSKQTDAALAKAAEAVRLKQEAKQRAAAAADQAAFKNDMQNFGQDLKGVTTEAPNSITLKPIPPAGRSARSQLDCAAHIKPDTDHSKPGEESWENHSGDCAAVTPNIPEPPPPTRVENQVDQLAKILDSLMQQITTKRETLSKLNQEVATREQEVAQESLKIVSPEKGESDALQRAREALKKARADRARTADELAKLEQQEQTAKKHPPPSQ